MTTERQLRGMAREALAEIDSDFGYHPGHRAAQAKGVVCHGRFVSSGAAAPLTRAAHLEAGVETPVTVRFSNSTTNPLRPDGRLDVRGMSVAFHLGGEDRTDVVALRMSRFLVGTAQEFLDFERGISRNPVRRWDLPFPNPSMDWSQLRLRLPGPLAMARRQLGPLCRIPSYASCRYNSLHAFRWRDAGDRPRHVRYSWAPAAGELAFLKLAWWRTRWRHPDYLRHEIAGRLEAAPVRFALEVTLAGPGDPVDDASALWGLDRAQVVGGTLWVTGMGPAAELGGGQLAFDPTRMTDGIELPDGDDLLRLRRHVYARSAARRAERYDGGPVPPDLPPPPAGPGKVRVRTGMEIAYDTHGDPQGRPLLLIMGFACPMTWWLEDFYGKFLEKGFFVIRFDNRDCGRSTRVGGRQNQLKGLLFPGRVAPYDVDDMAADAAGLLEALGIPAAHVMGISLGGMIAQALAIKHPERVLSLTSLASTPRFRLAPLGLRHRPYLRVLLRMAALGRWQGQTLADHVEMSLPLWRLLNRSHFPFEEERVRRHLADAWRWGGGPDPRADFRQVLAVRAAADRAPGLARLRVPAVVIHGTKDPLVRFAGGRATARAIPGARFVRVDGMGHYTPESTWQMIADEVAAVAAQAERRASRGRALSLARG